MGNGISKERLKSWKLQSENIQKYYNIFLGNRVWNTYKISIRDSEEGLLWKLIALSMFGQPREDRDDFGLDNKEKYLVDDIVKKCKAISISKDEVSIAVIKVIVLISNEYWLVTPVFRVKTNDDDDNRLALLADNKVIDYKGRVYDTWDRYKQENTWEQCWICTPTAAFYNQDHKVPCEYLDQTGRGSAAWLVDAGSVGTGIACGIALAAFPPTAPLGVAALTVTSTSTSVYGAVRGITRLVDRRRHGESLSDKEALEYWVGTFASALGIVGSGMAFASNFKLSQPFSTALKNFKISEQATRMMAGGNIPYALAAAFAIGCSLSKKDDISGLDVRRLQATLLLMLNVDVDEQAAKDFIISLRDAVLEPTASANTEDNDPNIEINWRTSQIKNLNALIEYYTSRLNTLNCPTVLRNSICPTVLAS